MAAGSNVYSATDFPIKSTTEEIVLMQLPLFLSEYGTETNFCNLFYCDKAVIVKDT